MGRPPHSDLAVLRRSLDVLPRFAAPQGRRIPQAYSAPRLCNNVADFDEMDLPTGPGMR